jgi:hypothetical protein
MRCSAVWSAHLFWVQRAICSNPVTLMWYSQGPKCKAERSLSVVGKVGEKHTQKKKAKMFFSFLLLKPIISLLLLVFYIYLILESYFIGLIYISQSCYLSSLQSE